VHREGPLPQSVPVPPWYARTNKNAKTVLTFFRGSTSVKCLYNACAVLSLAVALAAAAHAGVVYDNTEAVSGGADPVSLSYGYPGSFFNGLYDSFSTGATGGVLADLKLLLTGTPDEGSIDIALYSDSSTSPGTEIADFGTLDDSSLSTSEELYDIPTGDPSLAPDTRYWIGLTDNSASGFSSAFWEWSADTSGAGVEDEYYANPDGVFANDPNGPYQMSVVVSPEPTTWTLLLAGWPILAFRRR